MELTSDPQNEPPWQSHIINATGQEHWFCRREVVNAGKQGCMHPCGRGNRAISDA